MKCIQIPNTHIVAPCNSPRGLGQHQRLDACIAHINSNHGDAERSEGLVMSDDP